MTADDNNVREEELTELLAQYDEALAGDTLSSPQETSTIGLDQDLAAECERARKCIDLLYRVRRRWAPHELALNATRAAAAPELRGSVRGLE